MRRFLAVGFTSLILGQCVPVAVVAADAPAAPTPIRTLLEQLRSTPAGSGTYQVQGIVSARTRLADGKVVAYLQAVGEPGICLLPAEAESALLVPRNEVTLTARASTGSPFEGPALEVLAGSVTVTATNKPFGMSEPRGTDAFKDAASLAGRYVQLTNVVLKGARFEPAATIQAAAEGGEPVSVLVSKASIGRDVPQGPVNVFGIPVRQGGRWHLLAARILSTNNKAMQALATKHTCFTCHNPDMRVIGPAYRDVAAKYRNDAEAEGKLIAQMENGGMGKWGNVPMLPFKGKVPPEDMHQLAQWILGYRWDALLTE